MSALELFSPSELGEEEFLAQAEGRIRGYGKLVISGIVEIGRELVGVKERFGYRGFVEFVTERLKWSERTGNKLVAVFELVTAHCAVDEIADLTIDASSLYLIATPSTPAEIREQVLEKAATPTGISREEVEQLLIDAKASAEAAVRAEYDGKVVLGDDELRDQLAKVDRKFEREIKRLERECDALAKQRDNALANIKAMSVKPEKDAVAPSFDSTASFRAMCIAQAVKSLREELRITPRQLVTIEREMAVSIHAQPELAEIKLAELQANARPIVEWLSDLIVVLGEPRHENSDRN